ncbi:MAG: hypothetical protein AB7S71_18220 [Dongiaceae bacterium]
MSEQVGPNESSVSGTADTHLLERARWFDGRRAEAEAQQDTITVNGRLVDTSPTAKPAPLPEAQPVMPAKSGADAAPPDNLKPPMVLGDREPAPVAEWIADIRKTGEGVAALEQWPEHAENIPFAAPVFANVVNSMPADHADLAMGLIQELRELRPAAYVSLLKAFAGLGRQVSTVAGDYRSIGKPITQQQKGSNMPEEYNFAGTPAEMKEQLASLNEEFHGEYARNGLSIKARRIEGKRRALYRILHPGMNAPEGVF